MPQQAVTAPGYGCIKLIYLSNKNLKQKSRHQDRNRGFYPCRKVWQSDASNGTIGAGSCIFHMHIEIKDAGAKQQRVTSDGKL